MSFAAGRLEGLENVASEGISYSEASQVMSWKDSARHPCVCKICINLCCLILGHSISALITINTSVGFDFT